MESPGVRQQITQGLIKQRKQILDAALLEVAMNEAKIVNNLAANMLNNPGNLGLRPAAQGTSPGPSSSSQTPAQQQTAGPAASVSPANAKPGFSPSSAKSGGSTPGAKPGSSPKL
jgi:hypothetical protein